MVKIKIISQLNRIERNEVEQLFYENRENLNITSSFENVIENSHFYSFYSEGKLTGCVYFFCDEELEYLVRENFEIKKGGGGLLLFMNGFSKRKCHKENLLAIKKASDFYSQDIYSLTDKKSACFCLLRAGFLKISKRQKADLPKTNQLLRLVHK